MIFWFALWVDYSPNDEYSHLTRFRTQIHLSYIKKKKKLGKEMKWNELARAEQNLFNMTLRKIVNLLSKPGNVSMGSRTCMPQFFV